MKHYDIFLTQENTENNIHTGCLTRRFLATLIDVLVVGFILVFVGAKGESDIAGIINFVIVLAYFYLPEFLWRQTMGMYLCNIVVLVPPNSSPAKSLIIRRLMNLVEFLIPSAVYYFMVASGEKNQSLSDRVSSCVIARKRFLLFPPSELPSLTKFKKIAIPLFFSLLPVVIFFGMVFAGMAMLRTEVFWENLAELLNKSE